MVSPSQIKPKIKVEKKELPVSKITNLPTEEPTGRDVPKFLRQEYGRPKKSALKLCWRRPRGIDSKKLEGKRGKGAVPSIGYKKNVSESDIHFGFKAVRVFNVDELGKINSKTEAAVIASCVGRRKRNLIIEQANKLTITILNPRRGEA